jgi:hypothetical protein
MPITIPVATDSPIYGRSKKKKTLRVASQAARDEHKKIERITIGTIYFFNIGLIQYLAMPMILNLKKIIA